MSQSLRLLSWNTQMRSWAMEVGFPPSLPPVTTAEERAELIADGILGSPFDYDIVALCEVFDEDSRDILRSRLRRRFPWIVTKCDIGYIGTELGAAPLIDLPLDGMTFVHNLILNPLSILNYRLEDSGLMLFSKWPFATRATAGLSPNIVDLLRSGPLGGGIPSQVPLVSFLPFRATSGHDKFAAKGILYARIQRAPGQVYHVFFSHTQADADRVEEEAGDRGLQMTAAEQFIQSCTEGFADGEVFFMGDLNILGEQADDADPAREWARIFAQPGRILADHLVDLWGRRQCTGSRGLRDPGITASVRYHPQEQRLDYILGRPDSGLAAQHLMIDHHLATVPPGHDEVSFMSDHLPLRLDLARPRPFSTPHGAMLVQPRSLFIDNQLVTEGQVVWYRFDKAGTYNFRLARGQDRCGFEVYLDTNLSVPRRQYREEEDPDLGKKFVLASAPFLVKVFPFSREGETLFQFRSHLHQGTSPEDYIQLPYGVPVSESFPDPVPAPQLLNVDYFPTPWEDADTKWFRLNGPRIGLGEPLHVTIRCERTGGDAPFGLRIARRDPAGWHLLSEAGPGSPTLELPAEIDTDQQLFVCVFRRDLPALRSLQFQIAAHTDLSILLGGMRGRPRLICTTETSGWGADDIELDIVPDGKRLRYIDNDEIGDMEQDSVRDLDQWIPEFVPYRHGVGFRIIELDDIGKNDIGRQNLPPHRDLASSPGVFSVSRTNPDGSIRGSLRLNVDDGEYDVQVTVTTWDEQF